LTFARSWLLNWFGIRDRSSLEAVTSALAHLNELTAIYAQDRPA
jgi:hypothetical protein